MGTSEPRMGIDGIRDEIRRRGVRWTPQREAIVHTLLGSDEHLTAEELHRQVRAKDRSISAATVYRTVNLLVEMGVVHKRQFGEGSASFESALGRVHHDHLVCTRCGTIQEFLEARIEDLQEEVAAQRGWSLLHHRMDLFGVCPACRSAEAAGQPS
jgi:Fur family ferric uptake transcriptional regulator